MRFHVGTIPKYQTEHVDKLYVLENPVDTKQNTWSSIDVGRLCATINK